MFGEAKLTNRFGNTVKLSVFAALLWIYCEAQDQLMVELSVWLLADTVDHVSLVYCLDKIEECVKEIYLLIPHSNVL